MSKKKTHEIISYTYIANGNIHTAMVANKDQQIEKEDLNLTPEPSPGCSCGQTKCVENKLWRCMDVDGQGTCVWFITNESC